MTKGTPIMSTKDATEVLDLISQDYLDSRDLEELRADLLAWQEDDDRDPDAYNLEDVAALLAAIQDLEDIGAPDWAYGATFIRDTAFEDYARELAFEIGSVPADYSWPTSHIDWDEAAQALQQDYMAVDIAGVTYWTHE